MSKTKSPGKGSKPEEAKHQKPIPKQIESSPQIDSRPIDKEKRAAQEKARKSMAKKNLSFADRLLSPGSVFNVFLIAALAGLVLLIAPQVYWQATVAFPNWLGTAQNRFLDRGQPILVQVYEAWCPTVLNVPIYERLEWYAVRLPAFMGWMFVQVPVALYSALAYSWKTEPVPEPLWTEVWSDNWLSEFLEEREPGAISWLPEAADPAYVYFEANFEVMGDQWDYDAGCYGAGSWVAFRRKDGKELETIAIRLWHKEFLKNAIVFYPGDAAWEGAKTFVMHGANHRLVLAFHPMRHFPMDAVNGITKNMEFLPHYHVLYKLLMPHFKLTLPLEDAVMNSWFLSILLNPYFLHPFDSKNGTEILEYAVWEFGHYDFRNMELKPQPRDRPSARTEFLRLYKEPMTEFVRAVVDNHLGNFMDNPHVEAWGNEIAKHVPGWPSGTELVKDKELLIGTLTNVMFDLSFEHALQHYQYAHTIPNYQKPWRIHHRPPQSRDEAWDYDKGSHSFGEHLIHFVTNNVFFFFGPYSSVKDVDYGFTHPAVKHAQDKMTASWKSTDQRLREHPETFPGHLMDLSLIGPAIDY